MEGCRSFKLDVNRVTRGLRDKVRNLLDGAKLIADPLVGVSRGRISSIGSPSRCAQPRPQGLATGGAGAPVPPRFRENGKRVD